MDELAAFAGAHPELLRAGSAAAGKGGPVFAGGPTLYEGKKDRHPHVYFLASAVDVGHFAQARQGLAEPEDQKDIPHPRLGFFGVLDERIDSTCSPGWPTCGPTGTGSSSAPCPARSQRAPGPRPNIHYPGGKDYKELPAYLAGWDVAIMPFARNDSTRSISPTKTPEYLAAGPARRIHLHLGMW